MKRIQLVIAYDGTDFCGFQKQPGLRTVEGELEKALAKVHKGKEIPIIASGRTDTGVHARGQVAHFNTDLAVPEDRWIQVLAPYLPDDMQVIKSKEVSTRFHARYDAVRKQYRYRVLSAKNPDVFRRHYVHHVFMPLCLNSMREAASYCIGTHDFTSFCSAKAVIEDKVRTISRFEIRKEGDELVFIIEGNGFLYNMVRILVGTLLQIGQKKRPPEDMKRILAAKNRQAAGPTVSGCGLYLWKVYYTD